MIFWLVVLILCGSWVLSDFRGISLEGWLAFALGLLIGRLV